MKPERMEQAQKNSERRIYPLSEKEDRLSLVDSEPEAFVIEGLSIPFDTRSDEMFGFYEVIPSRVQVRFFRDDVFAFYSHDWSLPLGRLRAETLQIERTARGYRSRISLPDTELGRQVARSVERGDITSQSFGFYIDEYTWERTPDDVDVRYIEEMTLIEVSPVTIPAYMDTTAKLTLRGYAEHLRRVDKAAYNAHMRKMATRHWEELRGREVARLQTEILRQSLRGSA